MGHGPLSLLPEATGFPLLRRRLSGASVERSLAYDTTNGDEIEDLHALLARCRTRFPTLSAVCSGAIASDYQRLRVEQVCSRLGLVSLSYLWRRPQAALLPDILAAGIDARLIKVAAAGLKPNHHLGRSLADAEVDLWRLRAAYGNSVCGEGGEFETLVVDCPLFRRGRLELGDAVVVRHGGDDACPVGILRPGVVTVVPRPAGDGDSPVPPPGDVEWVEGDADAGLENESDGGGGDGGQHDQRWQASASYAGGLVHASVVVWAKIDGGSGDVTSADTRRAVALALDGLDLKLSGDGEVTPVPGIVPEPDHDGGPAPAGARQKRGTLGWRLARAALLHLYLRRMEHFSEANGIYSRRLPRVSPAARACVQPHLPARDQPSWRCVAQVDAVVPAADADHRLLKALGHPSPDAPGPAPPRCVLHVQSMSTWAPACIGPYAQACLLGPLVWCAGQIGLDPGTMRMVGPAGLLPTPEWVEAAASRGGGEGSEAGNGGTRAAAPQPLGGRRGATAAELERTLVSCHAVGEAVGSPLDRTLLSATVYHCSDLFALEDGDDDSGSAALWRRTLAGAVGTLDGSAAATSRFSAVSGRFRDDLLGGRGDGGFGEGQVDAAGPSASAPATPQVATDGSPRPLGIDAPDALASTSVDLGFDLPPLPSDEEEADCLGGSGHRWAEDKTAGQGSAVGPIDPATRTALLSELRLESDRDEFWRSIEPRWRRSWTPLELWVECDGLPRAGLVEVQPLAADAGGSWLGGPERESSASEAGDDGSTPPGWLAGLARAPNGVVAGGIEVEALTSPGAFALVHCASAGPGPATAQEEESLGRATVAALTAAGLGSGDVLLARHYAPGGGWGCGRGVGVGRGLGLRAGAAVTVVPVVGCGPGT